MFERYMFHNASDIRPSLLSVNAHRQSRQNASVGDTYGITRGKINDVRLGYNRAYHLNASRHAVAFSLLLKQDQSTIVAGCSCLEAE